MSIIDKFKLQNLIKSTVPRVVADTVGAALVDRLVTRQHAGDAAAPIVGAGWRAHTDGSWSASPEPERRARALDAARARVYSAVRILRAANDQRMGMSLGGGEVAQFVSSRVPGDLQSLRRSEAELLTRLLRAENLEGVE